MRLLSATGFLGYGFPQASLDRGVATGVHMIGADAGSTDAGPYYLGSGTQLVRPQQVRRDLTKALRAARANDVPLVLGSAGTAGGEPHLQALLEILSEVTREERLSFRVAAIHAEIPRDEVLDALAAGRVEPMPGAPELTADALAQTVRIVGQMGVEPFIIALEAGADVIVAGRACDTAIYAALPIMHGFDPGPAFHLAKIMECGAQCAVPLAPNDCMLGEITQDGFTVSPADPDRHVTVQSVAAHTMYEQPDPYTIVEPTGSVDLRGCSFEQLDPRTVRVRGSAWRPAAQPTIKLEGAMLRGYRTIAVAGARDPAVIANLRLIEETARAAVADNADSSITPGSYQLRLTVLGRDGTTGPQDQHVHAGVGVVLEAIASTQADADAVLALFRSSVLHCPFPGRKATAGNLAFLMSPSDLPAGPVYEFSVYSRMHVDDPAAPFDVELMEFR